MNWLAVGGTILQLAGVALTAVGFWRTWREFGDPDVGFFDPVTVPVRGGWRRLAITAEGVVRRLTRRPRSVVVHGSTFVQQMATVSARGRVQYGDLPTETGAALAELHRRTRDLMDRLSNTQEMIADGLRDVRAEIADILRRIDGLRAEFDRQARRVAIGGIRLEAGGLLLVALGTVMQWLGTAA